MFTDPEKNISQFQLLPGQKVADLGAGSGFYTLAAARAVGDKGKVYAVDVQKEILSRVKSDAAKANISNVDVIWGDFESLGGTHIHDHFVDAAIVSNILFQITDKVTFMNELRRILHPGGRVLVIDWSKSYSGMGPSADMIISKEAAVTLFVQNGFSVERNISAGASHYGFIAKLK